MVRPSGTEPEIKVYLSAVAESEAAADAINCLLYTSWRTGTPCMPMCCA